MLNISINLLKIKDELNKTWQRGMNSAYNIIESCKVLTLKQSIHNMTCNSSFQSAVQEIFETQSIMYV